MMSISGVVLLVITASILKPLLSASSSSYLPTRKVYDDSDKSTAGTESSPKIFMTLELPHLSKLSEHPGVEVKRQFDPWGGKKRSKSSRNDRFSKRKRQFSPWGGKRSTITQTERFEENQLIKGANTHELRKKNAKLFTKKRSFNSWGGKRDSSIPIHIRNFSAWGGKRYANFDESKLFSASLLAKRDIESSDKHSWRGKRSFNSWGGKKSFNSWGGKKSFNSWGGKKSLNLRGGKRSFNSWGGKKSFNSWGGKKSFNSWGGKRNFNSWGGKRTPLEEQGYSASIQFDKANDNDNIVPLDITGIQLY